MLGAIGEDSMSAGVNGDQADNSSSSAGAAYVFVRSGTNWTQQAYLKASNPSAGATFGISVAISADTAVVGAVGESSSATGVNSTNQADTSDFGAGAAYVFVRTNNEATHTWSQQAYLKASNTDVSDNFGHSVAVSGDFVVVGAWQESSAATGVDGNQADNSASLAGAAYVFERSGTAWAQQAYLKASDTAAGDRFGEAVSLSGSTAVVGAYTKGNQTGEAYVFLLPPPPNVQSVCNLNQDSTTDVTDVQAIMNQAIGLASPVNDLNGDGKVNVVDTQIVVNAAVGLACTVM